VTGAEFIRLIKATGKANRVAVAFDESHGKGSHGRLYYGKAFCTIKDRKKELPLGLRDAMLKQLRLSKKDVGLV
jgi:mRNA interferase HicA